MNQKSFKEQQRDAINQMKEMHSRTNTNAASSTKTQHYSKTENNEPPLKGINIPFFENLKTDGDLTLILGILLLLLNEKADRRLLFALIYILL